MLTRTLTTLTLLLASPPAPTDAPRGGAPGPGAARAPGAGRRPR